MTLTDRRSRSPVGKTAQRILITGARAPVALHLARLLKAAGHTVFLCDHLDHPLAAASRSHDGYRKIPSLRFHPQAAAAALQAVLHRDRITCVVPTCEEVFYLARLWPDIDTPARLLAPPADILARVHNKFDFITLCQKSGLPAPATTLLRNRADLDAFRATSNTCVFKPVWSRFAAQVHLRPTPAQLDRIAPSAAAPWVAQEWVAGDEFCVYATAHAGQLTALSAYRGLIRAGLGAAVCFEPIADDAIRAFVQAFITATGWTGQISFDVMRRADGTIVPLECNPRATSGVHFFGPDSQFADALLTGQSTATPDIVAPQGVRLAVWLYGIPGLFGQHRVATLAHALRQTKDILNIPDDRIGLRPQLRSVREFARIARRERLSLQQASTFDLEWDGPDQSDI